ncbi:Lon protease family protein [Methylolobus aquaticus]
MPLSPLPPDDLIPPAATRRLPFATTAELEAWEGPLGHRRAIDAISLAVAMPGEGYNVFVMGEPGTGRLSLLRQQLRAAAQGQPSPGDWLYLNRFDEPREPAPLRLPPRQGSVLATDIEGLIDAVTANLAAVAGNPAYQRRRSRAMRALQLRCDAVLERVAAGAKAIGVAVLRDGEALSFAPLRDGRVIEDAALTAAERERFQAASCQVETTLGDALVDLPRWRQERDEQLRALASEAMANAIRSPLGVLVEKYRAFDGVTRHLQAIERDLCRVLAPRLDDESEPDREAPGADWLRRRYTPRVLVSHAPDCGAPVIYEPNPSLSNLFGRIEFASEQGSLIADHHLIFPGALHHANGGFLILEAAKVLEDPAVWSALKRAVKSGWLRIESSSAEQGGPAVATLSPAPLPLRVKIALLGPHDLYYELRSLDAEFPELFRVLAEFDGYFPRDTGFTCNYARLLKTLTEAQGLPPLTAPAMVALCDFSSRVVAHRRRLSPHIAPMVQVALEADFMRLRAGALQIEAAHVHDALAAQRERAGRAAEYLLRDILDGIVLIDTEGVAVGRANALTLAEIGDARIGMPARVSATVCPGARGVVDIEREAELGQAIHSKGVMILAGYLGQKYARRFPLAISANLALEQSYGYVDGDSAALAELCALISALTGIPLRQSFAVTASINQYGEVQAVGGVNEKIEGFFELCAARSLNGVQGVLIPWANRDNLVLRDDVVRAARAGLFGVYPVRTVDEALELLTGKPAPAINDLALARLEKYSALSRDTPRD